MNQRKKSVSFVLLFSLATLLLFGWAASAYAQPYQTVTLTSSPEPVAQGGTVDVTFTYNTSDNRDDLTGFGAIFCFDSNALIYQSNTLVKAGNLLAAAIKVYDDTNNQCGFGASGKKIPLVYKEKDGVKFTSAGIPADLVKFTFQAASIDTTTTVKSIGTINAAGYTSQDGSATITIGTVAPTATPQSIAEADGTLWVTPNLVIIDVADAAAYAAGRITDAQALADVDLASLAKDTPIFVYCRDAANAKAEADKLAAAPNSFTKVYYLDDTFANWVAAVNPVKVEYKLTLTIAGTGNGIIVDPIGTQYAPEKWYVKDTVVNLTGKPDAGSKFDGFSVDATGTAPVDLTMNASKAVTATFSPDGTINTPPVANDASFTVAVGGQIGGIKLTGTDADGDALTFSKVTDPAQGVVTVNTDGNFIYDNPTTVGTVTFTFKVTDSKGADSAPATVTITVTSGTTYTLTVNATTGGTAVATTAGPYAAGTFVTVRATANAGYKFVNWTGAVANATAAETTVTMDSDKTVTANFEVIPADEYTLTVYATAGGTAVAIPAQATYAAGTVVTVRATANAGYKFVNWTGAVANATAVETTVTMDANKTVTANFVEEGTVTPDGDGNCDGYTDIYDALLAAMYDNDPTSVTICDYDMLDVNQDGSVNTIDALAIAKFDVGLTCNCILDAKK